MENTSTNANSNNVRLSLRDQFAMEAINAIISGSMIIGKGKFHAEYEYTIEAAQAYSVADAMLKERGISVGMPSRYGKKKV